MNQRINNQHDLIPQKRIKKQNGRPWKCTFSPILSDVEVIFLVNFKDLLRLIHSTSTAKDISTAVL